MKHDPINHHRRHIIRGGSGRGCSARGLDVSDKQFLKMADVFRNEMRVVGDSNNMITDDVGIIIGCYSGDKMAEYVLHAINSHDELVAQVERLREHNKNMREAIDRMSKVICGCQEDQDYFHDNVAMTR